MRRVFTISLLLALTTSVSGCFISAGAGLPIGNFGRVGVGVSADPTTGVVRPSINAGLGVGIRL